MPEMTETFGDWLRQRRETIGLSVTEVARRASVSRQYIFTLENNIKHSVSRSFPKPTVEKVDEIARALGVSIVEARLAADFAPPKSDINYGEDRLLFCYRELPEQVQQDALVLIEALWQKYVRKNPSNNCVGE